MSLRLQDGSLLLQNGILPPCSNASFALAKIQHFAADSKKNSLIGGVELDDEAIGDLFANEKTESPEKIFIENERMDEVYKKITSALSEQEWKVFQLFLTGMAYNQMALNLGVTVKSVDNAMQRVRRKLKSVLK